MKELDYSRNLAVSVREQLDKLGFNYAFDDHSGIFRFSVMIGGRINTVHCMIELSETGFAYFITLPLQANPNDIPQMWRIAEFLHRANYRLFSGNFEINMDSGLIRFRNYYDAVETLPTDSIFAFLVLGGLTSVEKHASGILDMLYTEKDPARTLAEIHDEIEEPFDKMMHSVETEEDLQNDKEEGEEEDHSSQQESSKFLA